MRPDLELERPAHTGPAPSPSRSPGVRAFFALAIAATGSLAALHGLRWTGWHGAAELPSALAGGLLGLLAADLVTGTVHWACDTWGDERTPWLGPGLIRFFREHHRQPLAMLEHDWIEVNGEPCAAAALALIALSLPGASAGLRERPLLHAFVLTLIVAAAAANQLHGWVHHPAPPRIVRRLQRRGLVLSPARHRRHHRAPHERAYCITGGWLDGPLDALGFWRALERAITRVTGVPPRAASARAAIVRTGRGVPPLPEKR